MPATTNAWPAAYRVLDPGAIREREFPTIGGRAYFDSNATTPMARSARERVRELEDHVLIGSTHSTNSCEARLAQEQYDAARAGVSKFFGAQGYATIFTSGTTAASNLWALSLPLGRGDLVLLTLMEHHSQLLTMRERARKAGATVKYIPVTAEGRLDMERLEGTVAQYPGRRTFMNLVYASNVTGVVNDVHAVRGIIGDDAMLYLDIAQAAAHLPVDLGTLGVDGAGVSAHKMYGPTGIGALFVREDRLPALRSTVQGGGTVELVGMGFQVDAPSYARFEPGTPNLWGAIGWRHSIEFLAGIGMEQVHAHDLATGGMLLEGLLQTPGVTVYGPHDFRDRTASIPFSIGDPRNHEAVAQQLDRRGVSVRNGCFCAHMYVASLLGIAPEEHAAVAQRLLQHEVEKHSLPGMVRTSVGIFNTAADVQLALDAIRDIASR